MKKQWIHKAQKDWDSTDGHDMNEKNRIAKIFRESNISHYHPIFDETIFINKQNFKWIREQPHGYTSKEDLWRDWDVFKPDLLFAQKNLIIELDGNYHFNTAKGVKQTNHRNEMYEYAGIRFIWYYTPDLQKMNDGQLYLDLLNKL